MIKWLPAKVKYEIKKRLLNVLVPSNFYFVQEGFCPCCKQEVIFKATNSWLRDYFTCSKCFSVARERLLMEIINKYQSGWQSLSIHESSPGNRGVSTVLKREGKDYTASHYYPNIPSGQMVGEFSCQNLEKLTFEDDSFDLFISQDVLEHVYDPAKAFQEIKRTLRKGGMHIFTTPLDNRHSPSVVWAVLDENGQNKWLYVPEYHGNPIDEADRSICTMHWGYDIVDFIKEHTGMKSHIISYDDIGKGIRGPGIEVIVSLKV